MSNVTTDADAPSLGTFHALQTTFSSNRRTRPPTMFLDSGQEDLGRVPLKPNKLHRKESKGGLRAVFSRNKPEKIVISPVQEGPFESGISEGPMKDAAEESLPRSTSIRTSAAVPDLNPITPAKPIAKPSRMNLRSKSVKQSNPTTPKSVPKNSPRSTPKPPTRTSPAWDPPPLFQAYPQAIKHEQLSASTLSADSILRISNHKRSASLREEIAQTRGNIDGKDQSAAAKKTEKARIKHRRQISGSISKADWTQKIFVLVTSGYLLQYSGEGSFDRLPEKMMQLGKDSVAFASDVIPGKHWVLQISQAMDSDGIPAADSRSLLSRLAFRGADYRRTATSLLLVLNSAEDMDSWIAVVRREIEALGGKKHVSETGKPKPDEKVMQLRAQPSHRYLVQRNPDQYSNPNSPMTSNFGPPPWSPDGELESKLDDPASFIWPVSSSSRPLTGHQSVANSITSHDDRQLENLRDSSQRLSFMSSGQRTLITSQGSSAASSPTRESTSTLDDFPPKISTEETRPRPNAYAINERRRSMQTTHITLLEAQPKPFRPHSTLAVSSRPPRTYSPPPTTPNFSVPTSSTKRFSLVRTPVLEARPIPTIITTTPGKSTLKGTRKAPPAALNITRPLSPVNDPASPKPARPVLTPTESSFKKLRPVRASMIDVPTRSPTSPTASSPTETHTAQRRSSLMSLNSAETSHIDFQFPRRYSHMQTLREPMDKHPRAPPKPLPLPAAALTVPLPTPPFIVESDQPILEIEMEADMEKEILSPLPMLVTAAPKLRRPTSMQIQPSALSPSSFSPASTAKSVTSPHFTSSNRPSQSAASSEIFNHRAISPAPGSLKSPMQRLKGEASPRVLANRRSFPTLVNGPPPAPPPDCALPPLPPGSAEARSPLGLRNSVRV